MSIGTSSIYTVGHFDGMVLVIDSYGGKVHFSPRPNCGFMLMSLGWRHSGFHE